MTRIPLLILCLLASTVAGRAQTYFSLSAGNEAFNFNVSNALPFVPAVLVSEPVYMPPPPPHHHRHHHHHHTPVVHVPMLPGLEYEVARPVYREVAHRVYESGGSAVEMELTAIPGLVIRAVAGSPREHYYYDDDDYYDHHKHHKKAWKRYKKHQKKMYKRYRKHQKEMYKHYKKHHKKHHHHDDDDD